MILNKQTQLIANQLAKEMNLPISVVTMIYRSQWTFIKDKISNLPDLNNITEDELGELQCSFNLPSLGKITTDYQKIQKQKRIKTILEDARNKIKKDNTTR